MQHIPGGGNLQRCGPGYQTRQQLRHPATAAHGVDVVQGAPLEVCGQDRNIGEHTGGGNTAIRVKHVALLQGAGVTPLREPGRRIVDHRACLYLGVKQMVANSLAIDLR
jgi:hypothetical protein